MNLKIADFEDVKRALELSKFLADKGWTVEEVQVSMAVIAAGIVKVNGTRIPEITFFDEEKSDPKP